MAEKIKIKCLLVGDGAVGKTCLLISYITNSFPEEYIPTVFDNYSEDLVVDGKPIQLTLWDTGGYYDYQSERLRPLSYPQTDVFMVCYSVANLNSFENISSQWQPELMHHWPYAHRFLVACKIDLKDDPETKERLKNKNQKFITRAQGIALTRELNFTGYLETSALMHRGIKPAFDTVVRSVINCSIKPKKKTSLFSWIFGISEEIKGQEKEQVVSLKPPPKISSGMSWHKVDTNNPTQIFRYGHVGCTISDLQRLKVLVLGGCDLKGEFCRSVLQFDGDIQQWSEVMKVESKLKGMLFPASTVSSKKVYLFGGRNKECQNELFVFDPFQNNSKSMWKKIIGEKSPSARFGATLIATNLNGEERLWLFGGFDLSGMACNDLYLFSIKNEKWNKIEAKGTIPEGRFHHIALLYTSIVGSTSFMVIHGGCNNKKESLQDTFILNLETLIWEKIESENTPCCYGHTGFIHANNMYIIGGKDSSSGKLLKDTWCINLINKKWQKCSIGGIHPTPRIFHSLQPLGSGSYLLFGGQNEEQQVLNDSHILICESIGLGTLSKLPLDIIFEIFGYLDVEDFGRLCQVSKQMREFMFHEEVWKHKYRILFGNTEIPPSFTYRDFLITNYSKNTVWINPDYVPYSGK